jgi:hypothetical protein
VNFLLVDQLPNTVDLIKVSVQKISVLFKFSGSIAKKLLKGFTERADPKTQELIL